jgi:hypothetical protein
LDDDVVTWVKPVHLFLYSVALRDVETVSALWPHRAHGG